MLLETASSSLPIIKSAPMMRMKCGKVGQQKPVSYGFQTSKKTSNLNLCLDKYDQQVKLPTLLCFALRPQHKNKKRKKSNHKTSLLKSVMEKLAQLHLEEPEKQKLEEEENEISDIDALVDDDEDDDNGSLSDFVPGPRLSLKQQIEKDKDDESLRKWKAQLLGSLAEDSIDEIEPVVMFDSIGIVSDDCEETTTPLFSNEKNSSVVLFTLKEGSKYRFKLKFGVKRNIVSGLKYTNTVWKGGIKVDKVEGMLGSFAPQEEAYVQIMDEETAPSGIFARGTYSAKLKFEDDDDRCHLDFNYTFQIKKHS